MTIVFLIPVFNDWTAVARLLPELDAELRHISRTARVVVVDDGSSESHAGQLLKLNLSAIGEVSILRLRRNLGHQRAIAIGLCYLEANVPCDLVTVMDGDGEDRPADVPRLLEAAACSAAPQIVFAERTRRSEGVWFFLMYHLYRALHFALTGERVRVGNFSVIPRMVLARLVAVSDLWNHYAAAVFKARLPYTTVRTARGFRYAGHSRMNVVALVTHGLSAMAAFGDRIGVRLLGATLLAAGSTVAILGVFLALRLGSRIDIPEWAPYGIGLLVVVLFQALAISMAFVFIILAGRDSSTFLPMRDFSFYVLDYERLPVGVDERVPVRG